MQFVVAALYHFNSVKNPQAMIDHLAPICKENGICGSLLIASEGVNGTIAGSRIGIDNTLAAIRNYPGFSALMHKESSASKQPFRKLKLRLKKEIVTMGVPLVDPTNTVGHYLDPKGWNELLEQDDVVVIDTRNDYEVEIGTFKNAINPDIKTFGEFPKWWEDNKERFHNKRVAMFCTGGIRCEKSTSFAIDDGHPDVYHLQGGILKYLEEVKPEQSLWDGECYVFDGRVSVGHGLKEGPYSACYACGKPITDQDMQKPEFERGVSCHNCINDYDDERKARFRERQKQIELSKARGESVSFVE